MGLREDYKDAFEHWVRQVNYLQAVIGSTSEDFVILDAQMRVQKAENAYRESRDRLTNHMVHSVKTSASA